ncbi:MAG: hypothetical protein IJN24_03795 [Bacteroidaceae bacterium]|nr:hypothetical protein [Bacteroidaceae bacterium]
MSKTLKYILSMYVIVALLAVLLRLLLLLLMPQYACSIYWAVPAFFAGAYTLAFAILCKSDGRQGKVVVDFMAFKAIKVFLAIVALLTLMLLKNAWLSDVEVKTALLTFLVFYILMVIPETILGIYGSKR